MFKQQPQVEGASLRKQREEYLDDLRRSERTNSIINKRIQPSTTEKLSATSNDEYRHLIGTKDEQEVRKVILETNLINHTQVDLKQICLGIMANDILQNHRALILLKKKLLDENASIQDIIDFNIIPYLLNHLNNSNYPQLNLEACWCIANICAGSRSSIESLVSKGLFEILPKILASPHEKIFEQGAWAVGNISVEDFRFKEMLLNYNLVEPLTLKIMKTDNQEVLTYTIWALNNLISGSQKESQTIITKRRYALPALIKILKSQDDYELLGGTLSSLLDIMEESTVTYLIRENMVKRLLELSKIKQKSIAFPALQIITFITHGEENQTQHFIDCNGIGVLFDIISSPSVDVACLRECLWAISNITAGSLDQMKYVFSRNEWTGALFNYAVHSNEKVKREGYWAICNSTKQLDTGHINMLIDKGLLTLISNNLDTSLDEDLLVTSIETLSCILKCGVSMDPRGVNKYQAHLETAGIVDKIEQLQLHPNRKVYESNSSFIETYFEVHDPI